VLPIVYGQFGVRLSRQWELVSEASGIRVSGDKLVDVSAAVRYRFNNQWDIAAGYRYHSKLTDSFEFYNDVAYRIPFFGNAHSWKRSFCSSMGPGIFLLEG